MRYTSLSTPTSAPRNRVIKKLTEHFPITRAPLRVRFTAPKFKLADLMAKLDEWNASVISKEESGNQPSIVCEIEPSILHSCKDRLKNVQGSVEVLLVSVHAESDPSVDQCDHAEYSEQRLSEAPRT